MIIFCWNMNCLWSNKFWYLFRSTRHNRRRWIDMKWTRMDRQWKYWFMTMYSRDWYPLIIRRNYSKCSPLILLMRWKFMNAFRSYFSFNYFRSVLWWNRWMDWNYKYWGWKFSMKFYIILSKKYISFITKHFSLFWGVKSFRRYSCSAFRYLVYRKNMISFEYGRYRSP